MSPYDVLRAAEADLGQSQRPAHARLVLAPPADAATIADIEQLLNTPIPAEIRELLGYASGFSLPDETCYFVNEAWPPGSIDLKELLASWVVLNEFDGDGTFIDINPETGAWEDVWQITHDPIPRFWLRAPNLSTWMCNLFDLHREVGNRFDIGAMRGSEYTEALFSVRLERLRPEVRVEPRPAGALVGVHDPLLAEFCVGLNAGALVYDLRGGEGAMCEFPTNAWSSGRFRRAERTHVWALQNY